MASIVGRRKRAFINLGMSRHTYVTQTLPCLICTVLAMEYAISLLYRVIGTETTCKQTPKLHLGKSGRAPEVLEQALLDRRLTEAIS